MLCRGERVTADKLRKKVTGLNRALGRPEDGWTGIPGNLTANVGHLYLDGSNGGYCLQQHVGEDGGATTLSDRMSAREMYHFLTGMEIFHGLRIGEL